VVGVYRVGLQVTQADRPGDRDGRKDAEGERATRAETCGRGLPVSKERHRTVTIVKTLLPLCML